MSERLVSILISGRRVRLRIRVFLFASIVASLLIRLALVVERLRLNNRVFCRVLMLYPRARPCLTRVHVKVVIKVGCRRLMTWMSWFWRSLGLLLIGLS